jgi:hypothetical protein
MAHMNWCATEFLISVAHVLVRHRIFIFVAKILWSTTHAPQNTYIGVPQIRFSLLVMVDGETSVMMMMKISSKSPSWQGVRTEFLVPNRGF